ncbi:hypothetical protein AT251_07510 [Enterovibrio nigricans]|nr:J domain-containing protein [Enterovibrio nigricans]PKF50948.1 hypothetical protein AT251_07510 [Enterovibrio nigricans]
MTIWEILGIDETLDDALIKKAYRKQVRLHHPEEDPDGFQRVRRAYEEALTHISSRLESDSETHVPLASSDVRQTSELSEIAQFDMILASAENRMNLSIWQQWAESVMMLSISQQEEISLYVLKAVMANRWLPPPIVHVFWERLGWQSYLRGTEEQQELGEFIDDWQKQPFLIPLGELQWLSHAEQRAILGFSRPLEVALSIGQPEAIDYLFSQPIVALHGHRIETQFILLRCAVACGLTSDSVLNSGLDELCQRSASSLSLQQWEIMVDVAFLFDRADLVSVITTRLLALNAFPEVADLLFRSTVGDDSLLPVCAAFLRQNWMPLPAVYWRAERRLLIKSDNSAEWRLFNWLHGQLLDQDDGSINHRLDLVGLSEFWQLIGGALWAGHSGSWAWLKQIKNALHSAQQFESGNRQTLMLLAEQWVSDALSKAKGCDTLQAKLSAYESDAMFSVEPLSYEELSSMSKPDWLESIRRHPLLPDSWFRQLEEAQVIVFEEFRDRSFSPHYADALCFYRAINRDVCLSSCWADAPFEGVFDWALWFYSHLATGGADKRDIISELSALPDAQKELEIGLLLPFAKQPDVYLPDAVQQLNRYPEQFVFRLIVDRQVTVLEDEERASLIEKGKNGDLLAIMALSRLLTNDSFDEAVVLWNLVAAVSSDSLIFKRLLIGNNKAYLPFEKKMTG